MNKTIVVIEDNEVILEFIQLLLQQNDFIVIAVNNGRDGLAMVRQHRPDLIMSDLHMAGGDGLYVLRAVRADPGTTDIPFVLVTADLDPAARQHCYALGATRVFLKPFDPDVLVDTIGKLLVGTQHAAGGTQRARISGAGMRNASGK